MNERIKLLAEQAWKEIYTETAINGSDNPAPSIDEVVMFEKKFAELIVKECMELASAEQRQYANISHRDMSESAVAVRQFRLLMKEHFGVEE